MVVIACAVRRFRSAENEPRRGRSSLRSGSVLGPRVCLSAVRGQTRIAGLHARTHTVLGPDHYRPFVKMSAARNRTPRKTMLVTAFCGVGHVLGFIGIVLGLRQVR